jgi:hypothetical protein
MRDPRGIMGQKERKGGEMKIIDRRDIFEGERRKEKGT